MATSLPPVSAKFIADVEGMLADLKRAERATKSTAGVLDREVDKLTKGLKKKFEAADIGKDVLKGIGIGSGFALAQQAAEFVSSHWQHAAESAQKMAESSTRQLELVRANVAIGQTQEQKRLALQKQVTDAQRDYESTLASFYSRLENIPTMEAQVGSFVGLDKLIGNATREEVDAAKEKYQQLANALKQLNAEIEKSAADKLKKFADDITTKRVADQAKAFEDLASAQAALTAATESESQKISRLRSSMSEANGKADAALLGGDQLEAARQRAVALKAETELRQTLKRADEDRKQQLRDVTRAEVERWDDMANSAEAAIARIGNLVQRRDAIDDAFWGGKISAEQADKLIADIDKMEKRTDSFGREMAAMWNNVSDRAGEAFADIVLTGEASFSKLADIVARSVLEIVARMAIINPLINAVFGWTGADAIPALYGAGAHRARGGAVEPGYTYRVNEDGQEFFKSSVGGTIMPVGTSRGMQRAGGGNSYYIDARGTDESVVARLADALMKLAGPGVVERRAIAAVADRSWRTA